MHPLGEEAIAGASEGCSGRSKPPIDSQASPFGFLHAKGSPSLGTSFHSRDRSVLGEKIESCELLCMYSTSNTDNIIILRSTFLCTPCSGGATKDQLLKSQCI